MTSRHPPVQDWATDFDHTDPGWVGDPYPIWDDLRQRCPVAHTDRDPRAFENPGVVQLDRETNRHSAFGLGRHRCLGSNLARMELRVALEEWLASYPEFELSDPSAVTWSAGQVRGPRALPVAIDRSGG